MSLALWLATLAWAMPAAAWEEAQDAFWARFKGLPLGPARLDIGGKVRFRYEFNDGFNIKGYAPGTQDQFLLERVRLNFDLRFSRQAHFFLQLQDAHAVGTRFDDEDFPVSNPYHDPLDFRQAFLEWLQVGGTPFGVKAGRQQISYGDQRVFGPGNWGNTGRYAWDAAMLKIETDRFWTDLWLGSFLRNRPERRPNPHNPDETAYVAYTHLKNLPVSLDLFYALKYGGTGRLQGESGPGDLLSHSVGFQARGQALDCLDAAATFVHQFGRYGTDRLRSFGANAQGGLTLPAPWQPRLAAQFTWGSGDGDPHDGVHATFDGVYGGADRFYGYMNLFFWANLRDYEIDLHLKPRPGLRLLAEFHHFTLDEARDAWYTTGLKVQRQDPTGRSGIDLGQELDLRFIWELDSHLELLGGYSRYWPGSFVEKTGTARPADWYYTQVTYSF